MKLAILETGRPPGDLAERFGDYPAMFAGCSAPGFEIESFDVQAGEFPEPGAHDAYPDHRFAGRGLRPAAVDRTAAATSSAPRATARWSASASAIR